MDHAHLESVARQPEMPFDPANETLDPRVGADGPAAAAGPVGPHEPGFETLLVRLPRCLLDPAPVGALDPLQELRLSHERTPL